MELTMYRTQILPVDMRIDLRRRYVRMAEHFLNGAKVGAAFEEMCGEGVAEGVGGNGFRDAGAIHVAAQDFPGAHAGEWLAPGVEEEDPFALPLLQARAKFANVRGDGADGGAADRDEAFLAAFAKDPDQLLLE